MNKVVLIFFLLSWGVVTYAQKGKIIQASSFYTSGKLDQAKKLIDEGMEHEPCAEFIKGHFTKGIIYQAIFESPVKDYKKLDKGALEIALESYKKVLNLDTKGKYHRKLKDKFENLIIDFTGEGTEYYKAGKYKEALAAFKKVLELENSPVLTKKGPVVVDTIIIFNAALAAQQIKAWDQAEKYYKQSLRYNYELLRSYAMLATVLKEQGKMDEAVQYLKKGLALFPDNSYILTELINFYLKSDEPEKAESYLDVAITLDSTNVGYYRTKGILYEKMQRIDEALQVYEKALRVNPEDFISQYNLANLKLANIIDFRKTVLSIVDLKRYKKELEKLYKSYEEVIPYFERALELKPDDRNTMNILRGLYLNMRYQDTKYREKYEQMKIKIEQGE